MSKKHKKITVEEEALSIMKLIKKGKVETKDGVKLNLNKMVKYSVNNAFMTSKDYGESRESSNTLSLDNIPTTDIISSRLNPYEYLLSQKESNTVVFPLIRDNSGDDSILPHIDYRYPNALGEILRSSTLGEVYRQVREGWYAYNKNSSQMNTTSLFLPRISLLLRGKNGKHIKNIKMVNVLFIILPSYKMVKENYLKKHKNEDNYSYLEYMTYTVDEILTLIRKNGVSTFTIDPSGYITSNKGIQYMSSLYDIWSGLINNPKYGNTFEGIRFATDDKYGLYESFQKFIKLGNDLILKRGES